MSWTGTASTLFWPIGTVDRNWPVWLLQLGKSEVIRRFFKYKTVTIWPFLSVLLGIGNAN